MAVILDTKQIYEKYKQQLKTKFSRFESLTLALLKAGKDYPSEIYISSQKKLAEEFGVEYLLIEFDETVSFNTFIKQIEELNRDEKITGIMVNRPLPSQWQKDIVFSAIDAGKDIEGVNPVNLGKVVLGNPLFLSPTVLSILELLKMTEVDIYGKEITIVGFSSIIGKPLALLLAEKLATINITHIATYETEKLPSYVKRADILISAVGKPQLIKGEWLKEGVIVIDVGTGEKDGKLIGDVDFENAKEKASFITPVPGGVGRLTPIFLFFNLLKAAGKF